MKIINADCLSAMQNMASESFDSIVTDPPYGLSFMGKKWDYDVPSMDIWRECLRVLKPGGHLLAFAGTRTQHRMAVRIEDAGFEIRDMIAWVYGSGFPKSLDISKSIDKHGGQSVAWFGPWFRKWREENKISQKQVASLFPSKTGGLTGCVANWELCFNMPTPEQFNLIRDTFGLPFDSIQAAEREVVAQQSGNLLAVAPGQGNDRSATTLDITAPATDAAKQWQGWGTALKPALEPITVARKPFNGTVAANVLEWGTGAINIDGCRVGTESTVTVRNGNSGAHGRYGKDDRVFTRENPPGRWPANLIHDGSEEVVGLFPNSGNGSGLPKIAKRARNKGWANSSPGDGVEAIDSYGDSGSAARFFYCAKASKRDRDEGLSEFDCKKMGFSNGAQMHGEGYDKGQDIGLNRVISRKNHHPTVKPTALMRYLCRLVTPPGGIVLDPFCGSGSTGKAAILEGFDFVGIELDADYAKIAEARIRHAMSKKAEELPL